MTKGQEPQWNRLLQEKMPSLFNRRSIRRYRKEPVPLGLVRAVLAAAIQAPTGGNMQPWEFIIAEEKEARERLVQTTYSGYYSGPGNPQSWLMEVPVLIAACVNYKRTRARYGEAAMRWAVLDVAAAIENFLLAAQTMGLGSCWIGGYREEEVTAALSLPPEVRPVGLLPLGYPAENPAPRARLPVELVVHKDRYNEPYYNGGE